MSDPVFGVVLVLHVLAGVVGFGALGSTGAYAALARRSPSPWRSRALRQYFARGRNTASRAVLVVPLLGGTLLWLGHGADVGQLYPWVGLALWTVATTLAFFVIWPGERHLQVMIVGPAVEPPTGSAPTGSAPTGSAPTVEPPTGSAPTGSAPAGSHGAADHGALVAVACRVERAAALTSLLFLAALVMMVFQPG